MVHVKVPPGGLTGSAYLVGGPMGFVELCSNPIPVTGNRVLATMEESVLDIGFEDYLLSMSGHGEHPCTHYHVDGYFDIPYGVEALAHGQDQWTPMRAGYGPVLFDRVTCTKRYGYPILSTVNGVPGEWQSNLANYIAVRAVKGQISLVEYDVTYVTGTYIKHQRVFDNPTAKRYTATRARKEGNTVIYTGEVFSGTFDKYTQPSSIADVGISWGEGTAAEWSMSIVFDEESFPASVSSLFNLEELGLIKASIALEVGIGLTKLRSLSVTPDIIDALSAFDGSDINNIENAVQACDLAGAIPPISDVFALARGRADPVTWLTTSADAYLWYRYVAKPTVGDVRSMINSARQRASTVKQSYPSRRVRSSSRREEDGWTLITAGSVTAQPYAATGLLRVIQTLDRVGLTPNLQRMWDLVPYSFVIDWFTNVSECLAGIDRTVFNCRYDIQGCTWSQKVLKRRFLAGTISVGNCHFRFDGFDISFYERGVGAQIPIEPALALRGLTTTGHILAGSALLITEAR